MSRIAPQTTAAALAGLLAVAFGGSHLIRSSPPMADPAECRLRIDVNRAEVAELALLPQIGPTRAEAIVAERAARGGAGFRSLEDLGAIRGIGPVALRAIGEHVIFGGAEVGR
ncbi:MAG: helix-hairpin-helix domain-containing protein [Phycisphaerae bacterium]|nr:helix-hairpin-helix domain-containing protein [Phycisphaerae bacterium]